MSKLTEDFLNWASNNKPVKFQKTFIEPIIEMFPDMMPTMLRPIYESAMNYDLFTKNPVVLCCLQGLPDHLHFHSYHFPISRIAAFIFCPSKREGAYKIS